MLSSNHSGFLRQSEESTRDRYDKGTWVRVCVSVCVSRGETVAWNNNHHLSAYGYTIWTGLCRGGPRLLHKPWAGSSQGSFNQEVGWGWTSKEASLSRLGPQLWSMECWALTGPLFPIGTVRLPKLWLGFYKNVRARNFCCTLLIKTNFQTRFKEMKVKSTYSWEE